MKPYYEVENKLAPNDELPKGVIAFDTLEEAIAFADKNECETISEIGGNWTDYKKCWFCGEWFDACELIGTGVCERCEIAIDSHEGKQWKY